MMGRRDEGLKGRGDIALDRRFPPTFLLTIIIVS